MTCTARALINHMFSYGSISRSRCSCVETYRDRRSPGSNRSSTVRRRPNSRSSSRQSKLRSRSRSRRKIPLHRNRTGLALSARDRCVASAVAHTAAPGLCYNNPID